MIGRGMKQMRSKQFYSLRNVENDMYFIVTLKPLCLYAREVVGVVELILVSLSHISFYYFLSWYVTLLPPILHLFSSAAPLTSILPWYLMVL